MTEKPKVDIEQLLEKGRVLQIRPQGTSMTPFIRPGRDEVILEAVNPADVHRGDILLYRRDHSILVLHRVHHRQGESFFMLGDNQVEIEGPVRADQLRGRVSAIVRDHRRIAVGQPLYVLLSRLWLLLRPARPLLRRIARVIRKVVTYPAE